MNLQQQYERHMDSHFVAQSPASIAMFFREHSTAALEEELNRLILTKMEVVAKSLGRNPSIAAVMTTVFLKKDKVARGHYILVCFFPDKESAEVLMKFTLFAQLDDSDSIVSVVEEEVGQRH